MSSLEKCKDLLQEVINELRNTPEGRSSNEVPKIPSTIGGTGGDVPSSSNGASATSAPPPSRVNSSIHEHRRLFGYNPRFNPYSRSTRRSSQKRVVKAGPKKVQTWTRQFVCLVKCEQTSPPQLWKYSRLQAPGLGQKKITLDLDDTPLDVDLKLKEAFPKLENAGGYCMLRTGQGARTLMVINGPYRDFMGQGKVFIRPLQKDLSMDAVASTTLEGDLLEKCFNCNKNFFLSELGSHLYSCGPTAAIIVIGVFLVQSNLLDTLGARKSLRLREVTNAVFLYGWDHYQVSAHGGVRQYRFKSLYSHQCDAKNSYQEMVRGKFRENSGNFIFDSEKIYLLNKRQGKLKYFNMVDLMPLKAGRNA